MVWLERGETIEKCPCLIQFVSYFETSVTINIFYIWLSPEVKIICHIDTREAEQLLLHNHQADQAPVDGSQLNLSDFRFPLIPTNKPNILLKRPQDYIRKEFAKYFSIFSSIFRSLSVSVFYLVKMMTTSSLVQSKNITNVKTKRKCWVESTSSKLNQQL